MNEWNEGYFTGSSYNFGYFRELNPVYMRFILNARGLAALPPSKDERHLELGYGQGVSLNIHAASNDAEYYGTDFNPAHAAGAEELRAATGNDKAFFFDDSFDELLQRDLPKFDSVSFHGIWSWISEENRKHIVEIIRKFLKPGGVVYNSYNCLPGWAPMSVLRELLALYRTYGGGYGNDVETKVGGAIEFIRNLLAAEPLYLRRVPRLKEMFEQLMDNNHNYLAHEYFNDNWDLMYFADVADELAAAKLEFACSTEILDGFDELCLLPDGIKFLNTIKNPIAKEQVRDYFITRQFRKEFYLRGLRPINPRERAEKILKTRYALLTANEISGEFANNITGGTITMNEQVYKPLAEYLAEDNYRPKDLTALAARLPNIPAALIEQTVLLFVHIGHAMPCQDEKTAEKVKPRCDRLNDCILQKSRLGGEIVSLASPLLGGGIGVNRIDQIYLAYFKKKPKANAEELAQEAWSVLSSQGQKLANREGTIESAEENLKELKNLAENFLGKRVPIFKALMIL